MEDIIDINTLFGPLPVASVDLAVDVLLGLMQRHQVAAACTLSTLGLLLDPTIGNAATRAACAEHQELIPVATLNPTMFFGDSAPLLRLKEEGFAMLRFFPSAQGWPIQYEPFRNILDILKPLGLPIMVTVATHGDITALTQCIESFPGGVILAGVDTRMLAEAIAVLRAHTDWHMEISRLLGPGSIQMAAESVGADRLLFGTGAPAQSIAAPLNALRHSGLASQAQNSVLAANARRLLHAFRS